MDGVDGGRGIDGLVVVVSGGAEEGAAVDPGGGDGVVEDAEDGVGPVVVRRRQNSEVAGKLGPLGTADRACDVAVPNVRRDA